jgi:hypothetical protein
MRLRLLPLLLLAACGEESRPAGEPASAVTDTAPAAASALTPPAVSAAPQPPDAGDPALFLDLDSLRWSTWETARPADDEARLRELGIRLVRSDDPRGQKAPGAPYDPDSYGEEARDYHFVDFSGDGVADVVYSGPWYEVREGQFAALEGSLTRLYQVMDGRAVLVRTFTGALQRVWKGPAGGPVSFRTVHWGCCGEPHWEISYHAPRIAGDTVVFEPYLRVVGREGMVMPTRFLDAPRPFTVKNDRYLLRASPGMDPPLDYEEPWEDRGNALAEYRAGARGVALAEQADATGRVWWFVRMDGSAGGLLDAQYARIQDDVIPMDRLGWMSSRFLESATEP